MKYHSSSTKLGTFLNTEDNLLEKSTPKGS